MSIIIRGRVVPVEPRMTLRQFNLAAERVYWRDLLYETRGNVMAATRIAGLNGRTTVYNHLSTFGLSPKEFRLRG